MFCKCCQELQNRAPAPMPDLNEYLYHCVEDDEEDNLRISRYYKKWIKSGGFEIDCPPFVDGGYAGFIFNKEHFVNYPNFDTMLEASGNQMKLLQIMNVTVGKMGCQMVFFQTLKCSVVDHGTICNVGIYQSVVSYDVLIEACEVLVFRRESDGQDLLTPDSTFDAITRFNGPVPEDTIRLIRFMMP